MKKYTPRITIEGMLYLLIFGIALGLRLLRLGDAPLSDFEAGWALPSWKAFQHQGVEIGSNPGYFSLTNLLFFIFGSSNFLARFWSAVAGSFLVLATWSFRGLLGKGPALIMALGLALDPGMVALSRLAGGPMMAIAAAAFCFGFLVSRKLIWASVFCGLSLVFGSSIWLGLLGFIISFFIAKFIGLVLPVSDLLGGKDLKTDIQPKNQLETALLMVGLTGLITATLFFRFPSGLSAWGTSLWNFLKGWFSPSGVPIMQPFLAIVFYQPVALVAAVAALIRARKIANPWLGWLGIWILVSLILTMIYPSRQVFDSGWTILPLWALAATEINRHLQIPTYPYISAGQAGIVFVMLVLFWLIGLNPVSGVFMWAVLISLPLLITMTTILVGLGWSWASARKGFCWGIGLAFGLYGLSAMISVSQLRPNSPLEIWFPTPGPGQVGLLTETIQELALIENGRIDSIDIVSDVDHPSLRWAFRNFSDVSFVSLVGPDALASIILTTGSSKAGLGTPETVTLVQSMAYRGQDFSWAVNPTWTGALPPQWWKWVTTRDGPVQRDNLILWARTDLFPDNLYLEQDDMEINPIESQDEEQHDNIIE